MKNPAAALALVLILSGCARYDINEVLLSRTEVSLSLKGKVLYTMNPDKGQYSFRPATNEYRVYEDDINSWFRLRCEVRPNIENEIIKADLEWVTKTSIDQVEGVEFIVEKIGGDGLIWLWCESEKIGLVIKDI